MSRKLKPAEVQQFWPSAEFKIVCLRECAPAGVVDSPEKAAAYWRANIPKCTWFEPDKESMVVMLLTTSRTVIGFNLVSLGTLDTVPVGVREVMRPAIVAAASAMVLFHNHPSGDTSPSDADISSTAKIRQAAQLMGIPLLDHLIMGNDSYSFYEHGRFTKGEKAY
jgi:DNA repair protein RadC